MRILIVGSGGRLGGALFNHLAPDHEVRGLAHADLDLADEDAIEGTIGSADFELLLTPAALTNVDYCEDHPEEAMAVNARAPGLMAAIARSKSARMIHFSTDYVFDGIDPEPRTENDPLNPLGAYGRSKAAGESAVLEECDQFLVARVSWIFGPERPSFLDSIIRRAMDNDEVKAIADKVSTPTFTHDLAALLAELIARPQIDGILHVCNSGGCTWQQYAQAGLDAALAAGIPLRAKTVGAMALGEMDFRAPRPQHTAMSVERFVGLTGVNPRPWEEAVADYVGRFGSAI